MQTVMLNQVLAIEKNARTEKERVMTMVHRATQGDKGEKATSGLSRTYAPKTEEGEQYPDEVVKVQIRWRDALKLAVGVQLQLMDLQATKDWGNCAAKSDIVVGGETIATDVPVTYLLFLEKQLDDWAKLVGSMTELDSAVSWEFNAEQGVMVSGATCTAKTVKLQRALEMTAATKEHPATATLITEDTVVGHWTTRKMSGAIPRSDKESAMRKIAALRDAVKFARENANKTQVPKQHVAEKLLGFVFGDMLKS